MSKHTRRRLLQTTGTATAIGIAGCSGGGGDSTITVRHMDAPGLDDFFDEHTSRFEEETGISVEYELMGWGEAFNTQLSDITARTGPDVEEIASSWIPQQVAADGWMDLSEVTDHLPDTGEFFDPPLEVARFDGRMVGVPWYWGPRGHLEYDPLLEEAGVDGQPETWGDLVGMAEQFDETFPDTHLFGLMGVDTALPQNFAMFLWQNGGQLLSDDHSSVTFHEQEGLEALNFWKDLLTNYEVIPSSSVEWGSDQIRGAFLDERIASHWGSLEVVEEFTEQKEGVTRDDFTISSVPHGPDGDAATFFGLELIGIHPWTDNPEAAAKWIAYLSRQQPNAELADTIGFLPTRRDSFELDQFDDSLYQSLHDEVLPTGRTFPQVQGWSEIENELVNTVGKVLRDAVAGDWEKGDTRAALDDAAALAQEALDEAGQ